MRTSGRGAFDAVLFIAPALIFLGVWVYMEGGMGEAAKSVDRLIVKAVTALTTLVSSAFS
ncbi:MAG TPA: hypothetical protein VFE97_33080 [Methylomirabilota bacterium]|nr:hypothetical protein [Methylomirabilota bacterium]